MYPITTRNDRLMVTELLVPMPDGVRLYTRVCVPAGVEKAPIVLVRTPYEPANNGRPCDITKCETPFGEHGYIVVQQHCRGCGDSEGDFRPYEEREDGLTTLEFLRTLSCYNGEIYLYGGSYLATVHLSVLTAKPHDVKGAVLQIQTDRMYYRNYRNGCNYKLNNFDWWCSALRRRYPDQKPALGLQRPYIDAAKRVFGADVPAFTQGLVHDICDSFWTEDPRWFASETIDFPVLLIEGWYDFYIDGMMDMWQRLSQQTMARSAMIVGPYGHSVHVGAQAEYPLPNGNLPEDYAAVWFDSIRCGTPYPYAPCGQVTYYSLGGNRWHSGIYPPPPAEPLQLWLGESGTLEPVQPAGGAALSYIYNPEQISGCYRNGNILRGHEIGSVPGVLSFVSDAFDRDERFFGSVSFHLNVSSDCEDTAFFMRVYFVENGESYNLTETVGALSHLVGDYTPGTQVSIALQTPPIAFTIRPGMGIRVDISSESGVYLPHANVKGHFAQVTKTKIANNIVYTADSWLELPRES